VQGCVCCGFIFLNAVASSFSLVPREGYAFRKSGVLEGNRIEFVANGRHYEWVSGAPILPNGGTWNLWVLQDPNYSPLFGPEKPMSSKSPGVMDKLSEVLVLKGATGLTGSRTRFSGKSAT
jgi:hypothetical protein